MSPKIDSIAVIKNMRGERMVVDRDKKRLKYIKEIHPRLFPKECKSCGELYIKEKMFKVNRWGCNYIVLTHYYCQHCLKTKEDVLFEVDSDCNPFGIAFVDDQLIDKKNKNRTKEFYKRMSERQ